MRQMNSWRPGKLMLATVASTVLLVGCASGGSADGGETGQPGAAQVVGEQGDGGEVQPGGTLSYAVYSLPSSLDPSRTQPAGTTGGTEMAGIYDLLIRYDSATNEFVPNLAKSMDESENHLKWTMKLRDGVTFSDGSALDADAVVASIERFNTNNGGNSQIYTANVDKTEATAPDTVEFTLKQPWTAFPAMLALGHGMVTAPSADGPDGEFTPIGAGAFTLKTFTPPETIELTAREDYWDGSPHLDDIKIVSIKGEQAKIDTMQTGGVDMMYLRNAETVNAGKSQFPGFIDPVSVAMVVHINQREGRPGSDVRVRQSIGYALDPALVDERARGGEGMPGSVIFQDWSQWHSDVPGISPDPDKARELLEEAKADGFDGKATYVAIAEPDSQAVATAIQAQLNSVGFDIAIDTVPSVTDMVKRNYIDNDFDLSFGAYSLLDAAPEIRLFSSMDSTSTNNIVGIDSPEMNAALANMQSAPTHDDKVQAMADLQTLINEQVPFANLGAGEGFIGWQDSVYGVDPSLDGILLLNKAWIKR